MFVLWENERGTRGKDVPVAEMKTRGGPGRGQGRPPVKAGEETITISLRMTPAQREKLERLGGAKWVRDRIDRAKEPNAQ